MEMKKTLDIRTKFCKRCQNYFQTRTKYGKICENCKKTKESNFWIELRGGKKC